MKLPVYFVEFSLLNQIISWKHLFISQVQLITLSVHTYAPAMGAVNLEMFTAWTHAARHDATPS
jgi:hypothetical protein